MEQQKPIRTPARKQAPEYPFPLLILPANLRQHPICPNATTIEAIHPITAKHYVLAITCHRWSCAYCSRRKIATIAAKTMAATPNRLLTLTLPPRYAESPHAAWLKSAPLVSELTRVLRKRFGEVEYLRVTELHKTGYPHYHLLVRSKYLPQPVVKAEWERLTGATIVDLRAVPKQFRAYWYLTKYLSKMHRLGWTNRHVSTSRGFFKPAKPDDYQPIKWLAKSRDWRHPYRIMYDHYAAMEVQAEAPGRWIVPDQVYFTCDNVTNWELGIPAEPEKDTPTQTTMLGEE